ncbi:hypothetical protein A6K24_15985 [Metabacillus litoralis]|uniref:Uncharacterized protein n=1 Tax=Metabacillus litoralis TaxID=152268 RepID=A0A179T592_9BACI|nr:hypothetical protein A6K24_15985 [Metabacillus litoralis]
MKEIQLRAHLRAEKIADKPETIINNSVNLLNNSCPTLLPILIPMIVPRIKAGENDKLYVQKKSLI